MGSYSASYKYLHQLLYHRSITKAKPTVQNISHVLPNNYLHVHVLHVPLDFNRLYIWLEWICSDRYLITCIIVTHNYQNRVLSETNPSLDIFKFVRSFTIDFKTKSTLIESVTFEDCCMVKVIWECTPNLCTQSTDTLPISFLKFYPYIVGIKKKGTPIKFKVSEKWTKLLREWTSLQKFENHTSRYLND